MKRWAHEADPELQWNQFSDDTEPFLRRKNRIGYVQRMNWRSPRLQTSFDAYARTQHQFRNVVLCEPLGLRDGFDFEVWLAYSPEFAEKPEGEEVPAYDYDFATGKWRRHD